MRSSDRQAGAGRLAMDRLYSLAAVCQLLRRQNYQQRIHKIWTRRTGSKSGASGFISQGK